MTNTDDPIARARELPRGAVFHRCALQVNPHHYGETFRGKPSAGDPSQHARAIVEQAVALGVSVLAITDHNDVSSVPLFRAAADGLDVLVFPGFELSSSEGVHVLCIYSPETRQEQLGRFLGEFGITKTEPSSDLADESFAEVLGKVRTQGGVAIAAHVTNDKGLWRVLSGKARIHAWKTHELLAIQIPGAVADLPEDVRPIVENKNEEYRRAHPSETGLAVAVVNAADVTKPDDLASPSATTWIKMSEVSVEGLRQAFLDPGSRIRLNPNEGERVSEEHAELVALTWEGGFLDGAAVHFNQNLNVLVGGRGTGKSTIVESIRSVLNLSPIGDEAQKAHDGITRHVLSSGTKISLLARACRPAVREYRIERTIPNPPIVKDGTGQVSSLAPEDVLPRVEVYGQHEISELTKSKEKLTRLLDRFVDRDDAISRRKADLKRAMEKNRRALLDARTELHSIEERLAALPGLEETLERFREAGLEGKLKEQSLLVREERLLQAVPSRLAPFRECSETLRRATPTDRAFVSAKALDELPGREILGRLNEVLEQFDRDVVDVLVDLDAALKRADEGIASVRQAWEVRRRSVQDDYERILRELQKSRVDGEEFIRLRRQIEELRPLREREVIVQRAEKEHVDHRRQLLAEWEDLKADEFRGIL